VPEWALPSDKASVPRARQLATDALPGLSQQSLQTVALVVSELVTNCVLHAGTEFQLRVWREEGQVRVEVTDGSQRRPTPRTPPPTQPHGRGLQIVELLARRWGVIPARSGTGKTVWCSIAV
jgi:anti-sigma regulatory factor (Ser/Thr protein kinase)